MSQPFPAESVEAAAAVVLRVAGREGPSFPLDPSRRNVVGRAEDSLVALADRLASRNHAAIRFEAHTGGWLLEDLGSRNGTWLDGLRVTAAGLTEGSVIRIGTTEFVFRQTQPTMLAEEPEILRSGSPGELEGAAIRRGIAAGEGRWSMLLYQAGIRLLNAADPGEIVATTLELAAEFTTAASFGWFGVAADGTLEPVCVVPPGSGLTAATVGLATRELAAGRAVWLSTPDGTGLACVPMSAEHRPLAVLAAAAPGGLREADFDLLLTLASMAAAARTGREPTPSTSGASTDPLDPDGGADDDPADDGTISLSPESILAWQTAARSTPRVVPGDASSLRIDDWQRALAAEALRRCGGSVPAAAGLLGVSRATLYRWLESWGLTRQGKSPDPG